MAKARPVNGLTGDDSFAAAAAKITVLRAEELFEHRGRATDIADIEGVHDTRVASRRLRAVLEVFEPCFDKKAFRDVLNDLKKLAGELGARRDPDVQIAWLERQAAAASVLDREGIESLIAVIKDEQLRANRQLDKALTRFDAGDLGDRLAALSTQAAVRAGNTTEPTGEATEQ